MEPVLFTWDVPPTTTIDSFTTNDAWEVRAQKRSPLVLICFHMLRIRELKASVSDKDHAYMSSAHACCVIYMLTHSRWAEVAPQVDGKAAIAAACNDGNGNGLNNPDGLQGIGDGRPCLVELAFDSSGWQALTGTTTLCTPKVLFVAKIRRPTRPLLLALPVAAPCA